MGEPRTGRWLSYLMQVSHGIGNIGGVPEDDRGDDEVEPRGAKLLRVGAAIGDPALLEDDLSERMALLVLGLDPTVVSPGAIWGAVRAWTAQAVFTSPTLYRV